MLQRSAVRPSSFFPVYARTRSLHQCVPRRNAQEPPRGLTATRITTPWIDALRSKSFDSRNTRHAPPPRDLKPRKMKDSFHSEILPLAQGPWLSDTYLNASGHVRLGALFMDLDALAGIIAYKHTGEDVTVVTAACDRIAIENPLKEICDLQYSGQVTYATGRSSMEITCKVSRAKLPDGDPQPEDVLLSCMFTMVCLDPKTKKPVNIPTLQPVNSSEQHLFELGEARSKHKKSLAASTLLHQPPNAEESSLIHKIWLQQRDFHDPNDPSLLPSNVYSMSSTKLENTNIMQPQFRNRHQFQIFGGHLMKTAYELAYCCCANFSRSRPTFVSLDPSRFLNPVPVGSVLYLSAVVAYTDPPLVSETTDEIDNNDNSTQPSTPSTPTNPNHNTKTHNKNKKQTRVQIRIDSKVRTIEHGASKPTGQFNYTFTVDEDVRVMPQTYQEFMMYIDARRRAEQMRQETDTENDSASLSRDGGKAEGIMERVTE